MDTINQMALIFGNIFALSNKLQILGDKTDDYMSMKQWMLIAALAKSGKESLSISELAEIIGTSYQNVKKMAVILEKQNFLALQKNPSDARVVLISLTEQCKEYFSQRENIENDFLLSIFDGIDEKTIFDLYNGILRLHGNVNMQISSRTEKGR